MQTAVEWLIKEIEEKHNFRFGNFYWAEIQQAKEIEKQQIIDAFKASDDMIIETKEYIRLINEDAEQYYNETYGSNGSDELGQSLEWDGEVTQGIDNHVPDVRKMVEDDNYLTPVDWLMDRIKWINRETYDYLIKEGQYDRAKRMENPTSSQTEISDEEIEKHLSMKGHPLTYDNGFIDGAKWYREQLKQK